MDFINIIPNSSLFSAVKDEVPDEIEVKSKSSVDHVQHVAMKTQKRSPPPAESALDYSNSGPVFMDTPVEPVTVESSSDSVESSAVTITSGPATMETENASAADAK